MEFISLLILIVMTTILVKFKETLMILIYLETVFLMVMSSFIKFANSSSYSIFAAMILTLFLVVDSVLGMSLLISTTRNTSKISSVLSNI